MSQSIIARCGLWCLFALGACFSPKFEDGQITCGSDNSCPPGLTCYDGTCRSAPPRDANVDASDAEIDAMAMLSIGTTAADLGAVIVGQTSPPATFTITNTGNAATSRLEVSVTGTDYALVAGGCPDPLAPGASCNVQVTLTPSTAGTLTGNLTVTASQGGSVMASLTATALAPGALTITPMTHGFGTIVAGQLSGTQTFTVTNTGGATTGAVSAALGGSEAGNFELTANTCSATLASGATCSVTARFRPGAGSTGSLQATLTATATPGGAAVANLSGTSQSPAALAISGSGAFGDRVIGTTTTNTLTVTNNGQQPTTAVTITLTGSNQFTILTGMTGDCVTGVTVLAASGTCSVRVQFAPAGSGGSVTGMVTVSATTGGSQSVSLSGNGQRPAELAQDPSSTNFGNVEVNTTSTTTVLWKITNTGEVASSVPTTTSTGEIEISGSTCTTSLAPSGTCSMTLAFRPSGGGVRSGKVTVSITGSQVQFEASATGMWRLNVTRNGASGSITSSPAGINCSPTATACTGLFEPGSVNLTATTTNGSGYFFATWSGTSAGTCAGKPARTCAITMDGTKNVTGNFQVMDTNLVFVTSVTYAPNLGSVAQYDARCNTLATAAGINNAAGSQYIAWLSSSASAAGTRMTGSGWRRMDGRVFATSKTNLLANQAILNPIRFTEQGTDVGEANAPTATNADGTANTSNCNEWTAVTGGLATGNTMAGPHSWTGNSGTTCSNTTYRFICMGKAFSAAPAVTSFPGKKVWLTNNTHTMGTDPNTACNADRPSGVTSGRALISTTSTPAASLLTPGQMYVRPDGQEVGTGTEISTGQGRGGIWQLGNAIYPNSYAGANVRTWTGSTSMTLTGSVNGTCGDWMTPSLPNGQQGLAERTRNLFWGFTATASCNATGGTAARLYCYEP